jgi:hypothetical protein
LIVLNIASKSKACSRQSTERIFINHPSSKIWSFSKFFLGSCAAEVSSNLDGHFEVSGLVMPGARLKFITNYVKKEIATLTREEVIVI